MDEEIVLQNQHLLEWIVNELTKGPFLGESDALAKYILALLETYALDNGEEQAGFAKNETIKGKCIEDLSDFLGDDTSAFVEALFKELETHPLRIRTSATDEPTNEAEASPTPVPVRQVVDEEDEGSRPRDLEEEDQIRAKRRAERFANDWKEVEREAEEGRTLDSKQPNKARGRTEGTRESRDSRDGRDGRDNRDSRDARDSREGRNQRQGRENRRDNNDSREGRDGRDARDFRDGRDAREFRDGRDGREGREGRDGRESRDGREGREGRDGDRRRQRTDDAERQGPGSTMPNDVKRDANAPNKGQQPPFPPMPLGAFPPGLMEMMAFAAANGGRGGGASPPPNPFLGLPFQRGAPFMQTQGAQGHKDMQMDASRGRGGAHMRGDSHNAWGRGRGAAGPFSPPNQAGQDPNAAVRPSPAPKGSTLYVRNLPPEKLKLPEIYEFFSKFGNVSNIQLRPAANPDRAFVEFATHEEALKAMNSVEAVMGNRHVRLYWARDSDYGRQAAPDVQESNVATSDPTKPGAVFTRGAPRGGRVRARRGRGRGDFGQGGVTRTDFKAKRDGDGRPEAANADGEMDEDKPSPEEVNERKRKEVLAAREEQKRQKLNREKEESDEKKKLVAEQKRIMELLENGKDTMAQEERRELLNALRQGAIQLENPPANPPPAVSQEANSSSKLDALKAKLAALKSEAKDLGLEATYTSGTRGAPRGGGFRARGSPYHFRGGFRGRGRARGFAPSKFAPGNMSLDLRPRVLIVSGLPDDSPATKTRIRGAFQNVETIETGDDSTLRVKFQTRNAAELAMAQGSTTLGPETSLAWPEMKPDEAAGKGEENQVPGTEQGSLASARESADVDEIQVDYEEA